MQVLGASTLKLPQQLPSWPGDDLVVAVVFLLSFPAYWAYLEKSSSKYCNETLYSQKYTQQKSARFVAPQQINPATV